MSWINQVEEPTRTILNYLNKIVIESTHSFVLIELGAADGYHSNMMNRVLSESLKPYRQFAIEPEPKNIQILKQSLTPKITLVECAISDHDGTDILYASGGHEIRPGYQMAHYTGSSSIHKPNQVTKCWPGMTFTPLNVQHKTLDTLCKENKVEYIDFIWADIQGAEVDLIKGGVILGKTKYLFTEYGPGGNGYYEGEYGKKEILEALPGFELVQDFGGDILLKNKN